MEVPHLDGLLKEKSVEVDGQMLTDKSAQVCFIFFVGNALVKKSITYNFPPDHLLQVRAAREYPGGGQPRPWLHHRLLPGTVGAYNNVETISRRNRLFFFPL